MKRLLAILLSAISLCSFGQQWTEYEVDSTLTITIPDNYQVRDTLGQRVITARVDNGLVLLSVLPNTGPGAINVQNERELVDSYKKMREGFIESQRGQFIEEKIFDHGGMKLIRFSFHATMGQEKQIRHCVLVFVNEKTYTINFWEVESMTGEMASDREKLFSSIRFPANPGMINQMSSAIEGSRSYNIGFLVGKTLGYTLMIVLLIAIIRWISKRIKMQGRGAK